MSTGKRLGHPVRSIKNPYTKEYFKLEYSNISDEELEAYGRGSLYRAAVEQGSFPTRSKPPEIAYSASLLASTRSLSAPTAEMRYAKMRAF